MNTPLIQSQLQSAQKHMKMLDPNEELAYHNWTHVKYVVGAAEQMVEITDSLDEEHKEDILFAAIWHDAEFGKGARGHEQRSANAAKESLKAIGLSEDRLKRVERLILVTELGKEPDAEDSRIMKDADLAHLAADRYMDFYNNLYTEKTEHLGEEMKKSEWRKMCITFLTSMGYRSKAGRKLYSEGKNENLVALEKRQEKKAAKKKKKKRKKATKDAPFKLDRGIDTMFRVSLRNHISLSRIADDKANTLISVNAIILSIVLSALFPKLDNNPYLIYPGLSLIMVSIVTIILATFSTIPKTTHGEVSKEDVEQRKGNLLFFGNFHGMDLPTYEWGVQQMMKEGDYLYRSLTRDLYFLGIVLNKKYRILRYAYLIFVVGLIISIILFVSSISSLEDVSSAVSQAP